MRSICTVVGLHVAVNNIKRSLLPRKCNNGFPFALLSSYKIFRTAVNNINAFRSDVNSPTFFPNLIKSGVSEGNLVEIPTALKHAETDRWTDRHDGANRRFSRFMCQHLKSGARSE